MPVSKREQLIETAMRLFCRDGFRATGIEKILEESGCANMTLYNHFKGKDELIVAALRRKDEEFRHHLSREVERRAKTPGDRLLAVFDVIEEWTKMPGFCGCMFINAAAEFTDAASPMRRIASEHKRLLVQYLREYAEQLGVDDPGELALELSLLMEGAVVSVQVVDKVEGRGNSVRRARAMAQRMIEYAQGGKVASVA